MRDLRKHMAWYLRASRSARRCAASFAMVSGLTELDDLIGQLDHDVPFPADAEGPRGRQGSPRQGGAADGWLDDPDDDSVPEAEDMHSGG